MKVLEYPFDGRYLIKKKKSLKTSIKKLIIKIRYLARLNLMKTQEVELDNSRKQKLEKHEKDRFSIVS